VYSAAPRYRLLLSGSAIDESPGWAEVDSGEALPAKTWSHVAMSSDGDKLRLYVNGELIDTGSAREAAESEGDLYLGCFPGAEEFFDGRIDEVRITTGRWVGRGRVGSVDTDFLSDPERTGVFNPFRGAGRPEGRVRLQPPRPLVRLAAQSPGGWRATKPAVSVPARCQRGPVPCSSPTVSQRRPAISAKV
jgi:hypothetical protein